MSWGTCYSGSNNIHHNFPPIMDDGRNFADWQPGAVINERIKKDANIKSNWDYRNYLSKNADSIIRYNQVVACGESCANVAKFGNNNGETGNNTPYLYKSVMDNKTNYGYENSNLKNLYLSDVNLQSRLVTPVFSQSDLLNKGYARSN